MLFYYVDLSYVKTELAVLQNFRHHCICFADDGKIQVVDLQRKYVIQNTHFRQHICYYCR